MRLRARRADGLVTRRRLNCHQTANTSLVRLEPGACCSPRANGFVGAGYHPHGIIGMGASASFFLVLEAPLTLSPFPVANFGTDGQASHSLLPPPVTDVCTATGFSKLFPGLNPHLLTLASNFQIPVYRDL